ncbi:ArsR/SmtB family transcription factor [Brevibacillus marinus]|uniref:ArsR/SmtB family transcription factor n=1 Tax=Brevibacillus marinus TaxID=2496837 RepID=UPI000F8212E5|nr:metalloregulator ArsR/SmtB family transcription factor [Brevibacillus marinus]
MKENTHDYLPEQTIQDVALIFKALADPTRIKILYLLSQQECSVNQLAEALGMSQSAVSHQLAFLRNLRLVTFRRSGNTFLYTYDDAHVIALLRQAIDHVAHQ